MEAAKTRREASNDIQRKGGRARYSVPAAILAHDLETDDRLTWSWRLEFVLRQRRTSGRNQRRGKRERQLQVSHWKILRRDRECRLGARKRTCTSPATARATPAPATYCPQAACRSGTRSGRRRTS